MMLFVRPLSPSQFIWKLDHTIIGDLSSISDVVVVYIVKVIEGQLR